MTDLETAARDYREALRARTAAAEAHSAAKWAHHDAAEREATAKAALLDAAAANNTFSVTWAPEAVQRAADWVDMAKVQREATLSTDSQVFGVIQSLLAAATKDDD